MWLSDIKTIFNHPNVFKAWKDILEKQLQSIQTYYLFTSGSMFISEINLN